MSADTLAGSASSDLVLHRVSRNPPDNEDTENRR
jgi:hypothetical protein